MTKAVKPFLLFLLSIIFFNSSAQNVKLKTIEVNSLGQIVEFRYELNTSNDVIELILNGEGFIKGLELISEGNNSVYEYYDEYAEIELRSKLSKIGATEIKYYSNFEQREKAGRISQIGDIAIDYYTIDPDKASKVYSIGDLKIQYYIRSNDVNLAGKTRSIGGLEFDYFTNTVDTDKIGKVLLIGKHEFDYYTEYDSPVMRGKLKEVKGEEAGFELKVINLL